MGCGCCIAGMHSDRHRRWQGLASPDPPTPIGLGDVAANTRLLQVDEDFVAVIAFVRHHLSEAPGMQFATGLGIGGHGLQIQLRSQQTPRQRRGVSLGGITQADRDDGLRIQVNRVLGLVRQVRVAILHLRDLGIQIVRVLPVVVGAPLS